MTAPSWHSGIFNVQSGSVGGSISAPGGQTPGPERDLAQADLDRGKDGDGVPGVDAGSTNDRIDGKETPA